MRKTVQHNPTKRTHKKTKQALFCELYLSKRGHVGRICKEVGIDRSTYYEWMKEPKFEQKIKNLIDFIDDSVEAKILEQIDHGEKELIKLWAKTKMKHRGFVEKKEIDFKGNMKFTNEKLTDNEKQELVEELKKV